MRRNISQILPSSIPIQNNHRLVVVNADAEPDDFIKLEVLTADALAHARTASEAGKAICTSGNRAFHYALEELADHVAKRRVLSNAFLETVDEVLGHLERATEGQPDTIAPGMSEALKRSIALSLRVTDLLAAERDVGWHRGIRQD